MTPNPNPSPELLQRARKYVRLATMTGNKTANPLNHVSIMEDMLAALSPQTLPAPGEVELRKALEPFAKLAPYIGKKNGTVVAYNDDRVTCEDFRNAALALATVAAANDEGVYAQGRRDGYAAGRSHALDDAVAVAEGKKYGDIAHDAETSAVDDTCDEIAAAIRLLPQGGGK